MQNREQKIATLARVIHVNRVPTQALIDTGSPATVVSLEFLLDIFDKEKTEQHSPAEWRMESFMKSSPPSVLPRDTAGIS
jgi:hypothetical protein